jgi:hypothetical protein
MKQLFTGFRFYHLIVVTLLSLVLVSCNAAQGSSGDFATVPAGRAYAEGKEIYFSHTEASDPGIAEKLSNMMKSPVLLVPSLAEAPASMLATVYVFENGVTGSGPLGFQPDVFDNPPGSDGYSPLRQIVLVNWKEGSQAREIKSAADVVQAESNGEVTTQATGVVVNMPFMVWDGGKR